MAKNIRDLTPSTADASERFHPADDVQGHALYMNANETVDATPKK